jgi:RNA-directed DNA polymerase
VVDDWFEQVVKPCLEGRAFLVRYADDLVMGFACEEDARRVLDVLPKRFGKYGLTLHPDKTRLVRFTRPTGRPTKTAAQKIAAPESFDFLGFTHFWSESKKGNWVVKQQTARGRFRRALQRVVDWCRRNLHRPIVEQHQALQQKLRGHYQYFGVIGNGRNLWCFRERVQEVWQYWLSRRRRGGGITWERMSRLLRELPLLKPPGWVAPHAAKP